MKAAVLHQPKSPLKVEELDFDEPKPTEVLIKLVASGVCHTDLGPITGAMPYPMPVVLGHEIAGIVQKVGSLVTRVKPGDHVVAVGLPPCGKCRACVTGKETLCEASWRVGMDGTLPEGGTRLHTKDGKKVHHFLTRSSFAEYSVVSERIVVKVRDDAPLDKVVLLGCGAATGLGAVFNTAHPSAGEDMAILGCGGLGLSAVMAANLVGLNRLIAVDVSEEKLKVAKELGATHTINAAKEDPVSKIQQLTGGGVDYALEFVGDTNIMTQAFDAVRPGGWAIISGMAPVGSKVILDTRTLLWEKKFMGVVRGSLRASVDLPRWVDLYMRGRLPLDKLITRTYPLDGINQALEALEKGEGIRSVILY